MLFHVYTIVLPDGRGVEDICAEAQVKFRLLIRALQLERNFARYERDDFHRSPTIVYDVKFTSSSTRKVYHKFAGIGAAVSHFYCYFLAVGQVAHH